jgi:hypothetical protein
VDLDLEGALESNPLLSSIISKDNYTLLSDVITGAIRPTFYKYNLTRWFILPIILGLTIAGLVLPFVDSFYLSIICYIVVINLMLYLRIAGAIYIRRLEQTQESLNRMLEIFYLKLLQPYGISMKMGEN